MELKTPIYVFIEIHMDAISSRKKETVTHFLHDSLSSLSSKNELFKSISLRMDFPLDTSCLPAG